MSKHEIGKANNEKFWQFIKCSFGYHNFQESHSESPCETWHTCERCQKKEFVETHHQWGKWSDEWLNTAPVRQRTCLICGTIDTEYDSYEDLAYHP